MESETGRWIVKKALTIWDKGFIGPNMDEDAIPYEGLLDGVALSLAWNGKLFAEADHPAFALISIGLALGFFAGGRLTRLGFADYVYDSNNDKKYGNKKD